MAEINRAITNEEKRAYDHDGVVCLRGILSDEWVERLRAATESVLNNPSASGRTLGDDKDKFSFDISMWMFNDEFRRFQEEGPTPSWASKILGSDTVNLVEDAFFVKEPGSTTHTPWHQDLPYMWLTGTQVCSFWIPLDNVTLENGAVEWIPGSHRWRMYRPAEWTAANKYEATDEFAELPDFQSEREKYPIIHFDTKPGDVIAHHLMTFHHAPGNSINIRRRAVATRYAGEDVRYVDRPVGRKPIANTGLKTGDRLKSHLFPQVWPPRKIMVDV